MGGTERGDSGSGPMVTNYMALLIMVVVFSMPAVSPGKTGWLNCLVPLPVFYYLTCLGKKAGLNLIMAAIVISGGAAILFGAVELLLFSLTTAPLGFIFFQAIRQRTTPLTAGLRGIFFLILAWAVFWALFGLVSRTNPYAILLNSIDEGLSRTYLLYEQTAELPIEAKNNIETAFQELRLLIPRILPALLCVSLLGIVWLNLILGNWLLKRKGAALSPWGNFNEWRLPEMLIWGGIIGLAAFLFLPPPVGTIGLNLLIIWSALYFFQGLAVLVNFMLRWSLPAPLRIMVYGLIIIQTYGIILLSLVGVADIWANFRKTGPGKKPQL